MKKKEIPQDKSALQNFTKELYYAKEEDGTYSTGLSEGWEVKKAALDNAWESIHEQLQEARELVAQGKKSPLYYFMIEKLMTPQILAAYTGIIKFKVKRHLKPTVFKKLKDSTLNKYADVFEIPLDQLKNYNGK